MNRIVIGACIQVPDCGHGIPLILVFLFKPAPGQIYTGTVFSVQIDALTAPGQVPDTVVTIAAPAGQVQPSNGIAVRLTPFPVPSSLTLTASGRSWRSIGLWRFKSLTPESGLPIS